MRSLIPTDAFSKLFREQLLGELIHTLKFARCHPTIEFTQRRQLGVPEMQRCVLFAEADDNGIDFPELHAPKPVYPAGRATGVYPS